MSDDVELESFSIRASSAWERLQRGVWGARWDFSRRCLDFTRASLTTLSDWLHMAAVGDSADDLCDLLGLAGQYFGETVQANASARWHRNDDGLIFLMVSTNSGEPRVISIVEVVESWLAELGDITACRAILLDHFDRAIVDSQGSHG